MSDKLKISWDDLNDKKVEDKLKQQEAVASTQQHYEQSNVAVPQRQQRFAWIYNAIVYLSLFGALGGLLGWGFGEILHFRPDQQKEAIDAIAQYEGIVKQKQKVRATPEEIDAATRVVVRSNQHNPYFMVQINPALTDDQKAAETDKLLQIDQRKSFIASLLFYGVSGVMIAALLAMADSVMERNVNGAIVYGSVGAVVGCAGGLLVALLISRIHEQFTPVDSIPTFTEAMLTQTVCWSLLGLFLAAAPGLILRNTKRLIIGMVGGLIGGAIGGLIYVPVDHALESEHVSRLIAIVCIGTIAGLACGIIENVVKTGWLKVESGLIAGKQFVLYRNPTFIGSHPMSHIYLFNDAQVGRRHACVHIVGNGYELEDLPLGTRTYVNGKPVTRQRLRTGDRIQIGHTQFFFRERDKPT